MTILNLSLRWNVVTEAISLQATLVFFGLLRYARNDKKQDRHTAFAMTTLTTYTMTISSAWTGVAPCLGRGNVGSLLRLNARNGDSEIEGQNTMFWTATPIEDYDRAWGINIYHWRITIDIGGRGKSWSTGYLRCVKN
ncbi:MAG: hypothetical protein J6Q11_06045 [Fibrobacteraceae bacterium]|nr:hypothetical protein [Fibrobacteraceae bacterium]